MPGKTPNHFEHTFYEREIAPFLPDQVLDFHTHIWMPDQWKNAGGNEGVDRVSLVSEEKKEAAKYMTSSTEYSVENLLSDAAEAFSDRPYNAVVFGAPCPDADNKRTNSYVASVSASRPNLFPLRVTGKALSETASDVRREIDTQGFYGYKVFLDWLGDEYPPLVFDDMVSEEQCALADEKGLIILLHVPRSGRLADPEVGKSVREAALRWKNARFVLAHCGRCYRFEEIREALRWVADLPNVWFDCSMVMDPTVHAYILQRMDPTHYLFATDYPIAAMRGRRVNIADHWVDVVLPGPAEGHYRVITDNMRASFMTHEIVKAVLIGSELAGLSSLQTRNIFFQNGMSLLQEVRRK